MFTAGEIGCIERRDMKQNEYIPNRRSSDFRQMFWGREGRCICRKWKMDGMIFHKRGGKGEAIPTTHSTSVLSMMQLEQELVPISSGRLQINNLVLVYE